MYLGFKRLLQVQLCRISSARGRPRSTVDNVGTHVLAVGLEVGENVDFVGYFVLGQPVDFAGNNVGLRMLALGLNLEVVGDLEVGYKVDDVGSVVDEVGLVVLVVGLYAQWEILLGKRWVAMRAN